MKKKTNKIKSNKKRKISYDLLVEFVITYWQMLMLLAIILIGLSYVVIGTYYDLCTPFQKYWGIC